MCRAAQTISPTLVAALGGASLLVAVVGIGLAWSGRGAIARVEITTDGGQSWTAAELQTPVLPKAHTRFRWSWKWDGRDALLASRAMDETGYTQPTVQQLVEIRGVNSNYHNNGIQMWKVESNGTVTNGNRT